MTAYIIRRLLQGLVVIIIVSIVVFFAVRLLPGDPVYLYMSASELSSASPEKVEQIREEFGLDDNMIVQYGHWVAGLVTRGDLGQPIFFRESVGTLIAKRLPTTLYLGFIAFVISSLIGISAGVLSALRRGKWVDTVLTVLANLGITLPVFWLAIVLMYIFGLKLGWFPIGGFTWPHEDFVLSIRQSVMPVFCLMLFGIAADMRQSRSSMLEVIHQDYVRTAWSKGLSESQVTRRHVLKNGIIPVVTLKGMGFAYIVGGSVFVETVFNINGIGRLAAQAVKLQDYVIVQAICLLTALVVVVTNLIVDISYGLLDPRVRYE